MGYVSSASTVEIDIHLSSDGRLKFLTSGYTIFKYFGLGDSDKNYLSDINLTTGFVPDITGDHLNCIKSVHEAANIKHYIAKDEIDPNQVGIQDSEVVLFFDDCSNIVFFNESEVDVYLHDYVSMLKGLAGFKSSKHKVGAWPTLSGDSIYNSTLTYSNQDNIWYELEKLGRGVFFDIYEYVKVKRGSTFIDDDFNISFDQLSANLFKDLTAALYLQSDNSNYENVTNIEKFSSPLVFSFNGREVNGVRYRGAGEFGVSLYSFDYGYLLMDDSTNQTGTNSDIYPQYAKTNSVMGFYTAYDIETNSVANIDASKNLLPCARIITKDITYYYPLNRKELINNLSLNTSTDSITRTTTSLETYMQFASGIEYIFDGARLIPNTDFNNEPYTLLGRQISLLEESFDAFTKAVKFGSINYGYLKNSSLISTTTGISGNTYSVSLNLNINSKNNANAKPAKLKVNFILSENALTRSVPKNTTNGQRTIYTNPNPILFGENFNIGGTFVANDFSNQLTAFRNGNDDLLYKKITGII